MLRVRKAGLQTTVPAFESATPCTAMPMRATRFAEMRGRAIRYRTEPEAAAEPEPVEVADAAPETEAVEVAEAAPETEA